MRCKSLWPPGAKRVECYGATRPARDQIIMAESDSRPEGVARGPRAETCEPPFHSRRSPIPTEASASRVDAFAPSRAVRIDRSSYGFVSGRGTGLGSIRTTTAALGKPTDRECSGGLGAAFRSGDQESAPASAKVTTVDVGRGVGFSDGGDLRRDSSVPSVGEISTRLAPTAVAAFRASESLACTEEYARKNVPRPSAESMTKDPTATAADAAPVGNEGADSADSSTGSGDDGGGGGMNQPRCGVWLTMIPAVQCENRAKSHRREFGIQKSPGTLRAQCSALPV